MDKESKIYIAGHEGMVGSILIKELLGRGYSNIVYQSFNKLDLRSQKLTLEFIGENRPEYIYLIAGNRIWK